MNFFRDFFRSCTFCSALSVFFCYWRCRSQDQVYDMDTLSTNPKIRHKHRYENSTQCSLRCDEVSYELHFQTISLNGSSDLCSKRFELIEWRPYCGHSGNRVLKPAGHSCIGPWCHMTFQQFLYSFGVVNLFFSRLVFAIHRILFITWFDNSQLILTVLYE